MIEEKIAQLGFSIPAAPKPLASYIPAIRTGDMVFTAGQLPMKDGSLAYKGKLGKELTEEDGKKAAQVCALNCLSVIKGEIGNSPEGADFRCDDKGNMQLFYYSDNSSLMYIGEGVKIIL